MDGGQNRVPEDLKKQLAFAVRNIQWSYAIYWSVSAPQPGVLEWGDGYYNGDIKTRKTNQAVELTVDQLGLQRSEQLRELYESLSASETASSQQTRRSLAALSPEDLTDTEWYYLVCMSFLFDTSEGLPGRTLVNGGTIWLCDAHNADSKTFSRSLLAKSASVRTVVCFPFLGGVVELGTTDHVSEDISLIQCVKTSFLESPYAILSNKSDHKTVLDTQILDDEYIPVIEHEDLPMASLDKTSNRFDPNQEAEDSFMVEGINGGASQVQSWHFMDDELSNCVHQSLNSGDCISQTFVERSKVAFNSGKGKVQDTGIYLRQIQEQNHTKMTSLDPRSNDFHYHGVLSTLFKTTHQLILGPNYQNSEKKSSFMSWKKGGSEKLLEAEIAVESQKMLKKVLFEVPVMHQKELLDSPENNDVVEVDEQFFSDTNRSEKLNERFMILRSIVPSVSKVDKVSILDDTIEYLQKLKRKVEELESGKGAIDPETLMKRKKLPEAGERTSANCGNAETGSLKKASEKKRKASEFEEVEQETDYSIGEAGCADHLRIGLCGNEVVIEMRCAWREGVLLEIMDAVCSLSLDSHSVQSSTNDGLLCLTIKCKHKGSKVATLGIIKQALQRVAWIC